MKCYGIVFVMLSAWLFGKEKIKPIKTRIVYLQNMSAALELMRSELSGRPKALEELCSQLEISCKGQAALFFGELGKRLRNDDWCCFREIWSISVSECFAELRSDEKQLIDELGTVLGVFELDRQLRALDFCVEQLKNCYQKAKGEYSANRKLYIGLPCCFAAMLSVLLA